MRYSSWIHREVSEKDAKDYADSIHAIFVETSAKNAININEVFIEISESVFLNVWHLWLLVCIRVHQMTQLSNIFQHLRYATEEKAHYGWIPGHVRGQGCIYSVTKRIFPELAFHRLPFAAKAAVTH